MSDNNLTIGATFDKGQLDAAIAEGAASVKQLPDAFNLAFREMSTSSQRALRQISADTKAAASTVTAGWRAVADASASVAASQREVRAAIKLTSDSALNQADTLGILAAAKQKAALAAQTLSAAESEAAIATKAEAESAGIAAAANDGMQYSMAYGTAKIAAYAGGLGTMGYAIGGVAGRMESLQPILAAAFKVAAPLVFADIIYRIGDAFKTWYDNTILLKGALSDLQALDYQTAAQANSAAWRNVQQQAELIRLRGNPMGAAQYLQKHEGEQPEKLEFKIKPEDLTSLDSALGGGTAVSDLVAQLQRPDLSLNDVTGHLGAIQQMQARLRGIHATPDSARLGAIDLTGAAGPRASGAVSGPIISAPTADAAQRLATALQNLTATVQRQKQNASGDVEIASLDAGRGIGKTQEEAQKKIQAQLKENDRFLHPDSLRSTSAQDQPLGLISAGPATSRFETANQKQIEANKAAMADETAAVSESYEQQGRDVQAWAQLAVDRTKFAASQKKISAQQELTDLQNIYRQENQALVANVKQEVAVRSAAGILTLAQQQELIDRIKEANNQLAQQLQTAIQVASAQGKKDSKGQIVGLGDALHKSIAGIPSAFDTMMNGVLMGTQRMSVAWRRMGADMAASFIESMAKIEITNAVNEMRMTVAHIAGTQARVAATAAGTAEESSIGLIATLKAVNREAVKAAGGAYSAVVGIPIIGPVLAPIAAGVAFAGVEAFGALASAEGGQWTVPINEQLTMLHRNEMVLPASHAEALRQTVSGGGGGRPVHFHFAPVINAVDRNGVDSMLREHGDRFASAMQRHIRKALA